MMIVRLIVYNSRRKDYTMKCVLCFCQDLLQKNQEAGFAILQYEKKISIPKQIKISFASFLKIVCKYNSDAHIKTIRFFRAVKDFPAAHHYESLKRCSL